MSLPVVDIVLPTGAMGNIAGGYMAKKMGLPLGKLNPGVNINDITHRVVQTGEFHRNPIMHKTLSEAINIQVPYNFERLLFYLTNGNHALVLAWMTEMNEKQKLNLNRDWLTCMQRDFNSARVTDDEMCTTIRFYLESYNYLVDPNTAVALCAAQKLGYTTATATATTTTTTTTDAVGSNETTLSLLSPPVVAAVAVLSTASPCKFQEAVTAAIGADEWSNYLQNGFPESAKRILELPEIPPIMYHKKEDSLADCQIKWEQQARSIIAELIKQGHQQATT
jgi:threonine synthase